MRNKKYRGWKLILILLAFTALGFGMIPLVSERWEKIMLIAGGSFLVIVGFLIFPLYLEVKDDRIVTRLGVFSRYRKLESSFKKRVFMFNELTDISVERNKLVCVVWMHFVDGTDASFSIDGFLNKNKIIGLIYEVRAQIKGYEQHYIDKMK